MTTRSRSGLALSLGIGAALAVRSALHKRRKIDFQGKTVDFKQERGRPNRGEHPDAPYREVHPVSEPGQKIPGRVVRFR